ncbi:MAG: repeat containing protein [Pedosphaera sp.]|nr:repeat containing protein [Pedosphaera sp.]
MNWPLLQNSLLVGTLATLLAVTLGFIAALWLAGLEPRWRARWLALAVVALCLPPFLVTNCWIYYLGNGGIWHRWLSWNIYSFSGTVWILALLTWPITLLATLGAWQKLEAAQLESDVVVTGFTLVRGLLLPLARNAIVQAAVLTFVLALNNFAVPAILQVKVFPAEVWVSFNTTFDSLGALRTSWPMILIPLLVLAWFHRQEVIWPRTAGTASAKLFRRQLGAGWFRFCGLCTVLLIALAVALPLLQLVFTRRTWLELPGALAAGQAAIGRSLLFAAASATLCIVLGLLGWRLPLGWALWLPFLIPGVLLGIGLIAVFNRPIFAAFYQSAGIVILAFGIRYLALGWNGVAHAMRTVDHDLTDAAKLNGASRWQMLRLVHWPQISPAVAAVWYLIFLLCLWDVESMVLVVPPGGETLALRVFNLLHYGHNPQVNALCLALLALALLPLLLWRTGRWFAGWRRGGALATLLIAVLTIAGCSQNNARESVIESKIFSRVQVIGSRGVGLGEFNKPRSLTVDRQDNLYVVDMTGRVQKFSPDGQFLLSWQMPQTDLGKPKGMSCDKDGNILVVEPHYQRVNHFSPDGKLVAQWGVHGTNAGQLTLPRSIAVDSHGNIFVTEYTVVDRVQEFTADGKKLLNIFGQPGIERGEFNRAEGMAIDAKDRIYIADSCNHRVQVFSPEGKWLREYGKAGNGVGELSYPYDIRVDAAGRQYVCEFGNSRIQIFDANDQPLEILGGVGGAPGQFSNPWSIALDSKGNLYVADSQNHRVQKFLKKQQTAMVSNRGVRP